MNQLQLQTLLHVSWFAFSGTDINRIEEDQFSVFAPNAKALKEAVDRINEITTIKVQTLGYSAHRKNCLY